LLSLLVIDAGVDPTYLYQFLYGEKNIVFPCWMLYRVWLFSGQMQRFRGLRRRSKNRAIVRFLLIKPWQ